MGSIASPSDLSGLTIWFDADASANISVISGKVTTWNASFPLSGTKPTLRPMTKSDLNVTSVNTNSYTYDSFYGYTATLRKYEKSKINNIEYESLTSFNDDISQNTLNSRKIINFNNGMLKFTNINSSTLFTKNRNNNFTYSATYLLKKNVNNRAYIFNTTNNTSNYYIQDNTTYSSFGNKNNTLTITKDNSASNSDIFNNILYNDWLIYTVVFNNNFTRNLISQKRQYYINGINIGAFDITTNTVEPADFLLNSSNGRAFIGNVATQRKTSYYYTGNRVLNLSDLNPRTNYTYDYDISGFNGSIAEIIFYNEYKTADDLRKVNDYLLAKWGNSIISALPTQPPAISQLIFLDNKTLQENIDESIKPLFLTNTIKIFDGATEITDIANITNKTYNVRYQITSAVSGNFDVPIKKAEGSAGDLYVFSAGATTTQLSHTNSDGTATGLNYKWYFDASSTVVTTVANPSLILPNQFITTVTPSISFTDSNYGTFSYDLTPTQVVRLDRVFLATQYLQAEGQSLTIPTDPALATLTGVTYQWFKGNTPIVGATGLSYTIPSPSASDSADYKLQITYNGVAYDSSITRLDVIIGPVENLMRAIGESATFSIEPILGATYQWRRSDNIEGTTSAIANRTTASFTLSSIKSTDYGAISVSVTKNGVTGTSRDCYLTDYTSITMNNGIRQRFNFPRNVTYTFLEVTPDGRFVFITDDTPRRLCVTDPGFVDQTSFEQNIRLYEFPHPTLNTATLTASSLLPNIYSYNGIFGHGSGNTYFFGDELRAYTDDGRYLAVVCSGAINYRQNGKVESNKSCGYILIYKLDGPSISLIQTMIIPFLNGGTLELNKAVTHEDIPITITFSGDGTYLGVVYGKGKSYVSGMTDTFRIFKKNEEQDTWGTLIQPSTASNAFQNVTHNFVIAPRAGSDDGILYAGRFNSDGTFLSLCTRAYSSYTNSSFIKNYFIYNINKTTNTFTRNTTLEDRIAIELQKIAPATQYNQTIVSTFPMILYFAPDDPTILIGYSNQRDGANISYKGHLYFFKYDLSTQMPSLLHYYSFYSYPSNLTSTPTDTDRAKRTMLISLDGKYMLNSYNQYVNTTSSADSMNRIFKIPNYYLNRTNLGTGDISTVGADANSFARTVNTYETNGLNGNSNMRCFLHRNKYILIQPSEKTTRNGNFVIKTINDNNSIVKPIITNTSDILYKDEVLERSNSSNIGIDTLLTNTFSSSVKGILLRVKNNRDANNNVVGTWRFASSSYASLPSSGLTLTNLSTTYSSSGTDKWYLFYTAAAAESYIRLEMDNARLFNNDASPNNKMTLEYKLWSGFGFNNNPGFADTIFTKRINDTNTHSFTINGSIVTIVDMEKTPFSNETGSLQINVRNVIDAPDWFGRFYAPAIPNGTGANRDDTQRRYVYSMNVLRRSFYSDPFSLQDIMNIFRPTISNEIPVNTSNSYNANDLSGVGIGMSITNNFCVQISTDGGTTWNFLKNGNPDAFAYFFLLRVKNYLFRYVHQGASGTSTTNFMTKLNIYIFPWNGVDFTGGSSVIKEYSSCNPTADADNQINMTTQTKIAAAEIEKANISTLPAKGKYVSGDTTVNSSTPGLTGSGIYANIVSTTKPEFKNSSNLSFPIKIVNENNTVVDASINDNQTNPLSFTPNDLIYGYIRNGVRSNAITLRPGLTINDNCDVYDPDISGDKQLLGLIIPRDSTVNSLAGKWQYTTTGNSSTPSWLDLFESNSSTNVIRFWSYLKNDNKVRLRFLPNTLEKSASISLPFFIYDGGDFIPYGVSTSSSIHSSSYDINGTSFAISTPSTNTTTHRSTLQGNLLLQVNHINTAPVFTLASYTPLVSSTYSYNSQMDISFNKTIPIEKHIETASYSYSSTTGITTATITRKKNVFRVQVADILNSSAVSDTRDTFDIKGLVIYSGDFANTVFKIYYTNGTVETVQASAIDLSNAILIPNFITGNPPYANYYNITPTTNNMYGWLNPIDISFGSRLELINTNQVRYIKDRYNVFNPTSTAPHYNIMQGNSTGPILIPNEINGFPVMRYTRSGTGNGISGNELQPVFHTTASDLRFLKNTIIIVERPRSVDENGFNGIIGDSQANYFFGYTSRNTITLSYNNRGAVGNATQRPITLTYSDAFIDINPAIPQQPRVWTIYIGSAATDFPQINLNGRMVALSSFNTRPSVFNNNPLMRLGGNIWWNTSGPNRWYDGDICDVISLNSSMTLNDIKAYEQYLIHKWVNPQIYIEPILNQTVDLSYNFYVWDGSNRESLTTNYDNVNTRGGQTPYSVNGSKFTIKIKKANSRPVLSMSQSTIDNAAILTSFSSSTDPKKLAFKLNDLDIATQVHEFTLRSIFDDIIRTRYTDDDLTGTPPDVKGLAITSVDNTLGTWSVVKSDGTVQVLTDISSTSAYLIKRDTIGNKLRLTLNSTSVLTTNRFHRTAVAGLPGSTFFQAIGWDSTRSKQSEYDKVNLITAAVNDLTDVENPFSILNNGVFEFRATTRPSISGTTSQKLFVYNDNPTLNIITPMNLINQFNTSQITSGTKRIDINSIDNLNSEITLQYQDGSGSTWTDIVLPLTTPINGNYPIRVEKSTEEKAVNQTFSLLMTLYDPGTTLYSPNFGSINIQVQEANLPPSIQINTSATTRTRISNISSTTITYETIFNDIGNGLPGEDPPLFDFRTYASFNSNLGIKPIVWADTNKSSNLKINAFALEIGNALNGRFYYQNVDGDFKDITVSNTNRFLLSSANTLKYIPTAGNSGKAIIRLYAWDGVQGTIGTPAEMNTDGTYTQGAFSSTFITIEFPVIPRNNAPTFTTDNKLFSSVFQQTDTNEDISGVSIKFIIDDLFSKFEYNEANSVNEKGFVIIDPSGAGLGTWQTSTNGGTSWTTAASGLHLLADTLNANRLRFQFNTNRPSFPNSYSEIPFVRVAAWDKTNSVANGQIATIDTSGAAAAYSSETIRLAAAISHRNHAPTLTAGTALFSLGSVNANAFIDISYQTILTAIGVGVLADPDLGDTIGIKITDISFNNTPSAGASMGTWSYTNSILNGQYVTIGSAGAELIPTRNPVIRFQADKYVYGSTTLCFRAFDGVLTSENTRKLVLAVNDINYAPTYTNTQDISYNVVFDVSRTILISSITSALNPSDRNPGTNYGIVLSASSFDSAIALIEYSLNPNGTTPIYNTITNSQFGSSQTAIHLPFDAAIRYTARLNQPISISLDILLWDRSNNSAVVAAAGNAIAVPTIRDEFSPYSADSVKLVFNHQQVNFAPTITNSSSILQTITALETTNTFPVSDLLTRIGWADRNSGDRAGLAIIGLDICGGLYEYTIDDGANWTALPSNLSATNGLHFDNVSTSAIRYRSTRNTTDFSTFTVVGWDQTTAVTYGTVVSIPATRGGNTSYSSNNHTFRVDQTHVNSRPVMTAGNNTTTSAVDYKDTDYTWFQFSDFIPVSSTFSDPDYALFRRGGVPQVTDKTFGILITSVDTSGGSWLISSNRSTVTDVTTASASAAIIASPTDYFALRTSKNNSLTFRLTYKAWDKTARTTTTMVDTTDPTTNTSYSENSGTINIPVLHVNTPPTIKTDISGFQGTTISGDSDDNPNPTGFTVASIIDDLVARGVYVDPDTRDWGYTAEPTGLIVIGSTLSSTTGTWSYSTDSGSSWTSISTSGSRRLHLTYSANNRIRYRPSNNANGTAVLRVAAWDQSNGVANGAVESVVSSQRTDTIGQSYSVNETTIRVPTLYLNHAPQFTTLTYTMPEVEFGNVNAGRAWTNILTSLGYTDKDTQDPQGLVVDTITIPAGLTGTFQVLSGTTWTTATTGLQFTLPTYSSLRFAPAANITVDELTASIVIRPFDGQLSGTTSATINVPVIKALFSPSISATLSPSAVVNFRADNRLTPLGGVSQGVTITKLLNDMGFTDINAGEGRGMAIQSIATKGISGFFEVKLGNGAWTRLPTISRNNYYLLSEFTGSVVNRIRFNSTVRNKTGTASITFFGWDLSDVGPGIASGSLKQYTSSQKPVSFSARNGTYRMNIQGIVGR